MSAGRTGSGTRLSQALRVLAAGAALAAPFRHAASAADAKAPDNAVVIDPKPLFDISPRLYLQFMEPLSATDSAIEASWSYDADDWRKDFVETTRDLAPDVMRYGGLFSRYYKWREGVSPVEKQPLPAARRTGENLHRLRLQRHALDDQLADDAGAGGASWLLPSGTVMRLFKRHNGKQGVAGKSATTGLDIAAIRTGDKIFLHVANTNYARSTEASFAIDGLELMGGRVLQIGPEKTRQEISSRNPDVFKPKEFLLHPEARLSWRFPARSVCVVELDCRAV